MVSSGAIIALNAALLVCLLLPVIAYLFCRGRVRLRLRNIAVGAVCFILFALVLEGLLNRYLLVLDPVSAAWFKAHPIIFALYGALAAGVFEETGRYFGLSFLVRKEEGAGLAYGIGHGGAESVLIGGLGFLQSAMFAVLLNEGRLDSVLGAHLPPGAAETIRAQLEHLTFWGALPGAIERGSALVLQIALSLLVWQAVKNRRASLYLLAIAAHAGADIPAALKQAGLLHLGAWTFEAIYAAIAVVLLAVLLPRLPARRAKPAAS